MEIQSLNDVIEAIGGNYLNKLECEGLASRLRVHYEGKTPDKIIEEHRPFEPDNIQAYRKEIYVPKTKNPVCKVIASLEKIRRAQDWNIAYKPDVVPARIADGETLQDYCEYNYPVMDSVTNWAFAELLRQSLIDANGIVAVVLEDIPQSAGEYCKPVAKFFESGQVVNYAEGEYVVLLSHDKTSYYQNSGKGRRVITNGAIYYILTQTQFIKYKQIGNNSFQKTDVFNHNIGQLPAWKCGGLFRARKNNDTIFESRIAGMVPDLDEAARLYSDLQAELVMHVFSEKYEYTNTECPECKGLGHTIVDGKKKTCSKCGGTGKIVNVSPYGVHIINASQLGEGNLPTPPVGYVQKGTEIATLLDKMVRDRCKDALAAVNMEFLAETPIEQSGTAKAYDANELNNFVNAVAEDLVRNLDKVYYFINEYRYGLVVPDKKIRKDMLPMINVPTKFDIANTSILMQELQGARNAKVNPVIQRQLEIAYAKAQFNTDPETARMTETTFNLDPLFGIEQENKMTMLQNKGITEIDYIISCNIQNFVRRAIKENADFYSQKYEEQMKKLKEYAEEVQEANKSVQEPQVDFGGLGNGIPTDDGAEGEGTESDKDVKEEVEE